MTTRSSRSASPAATGAALRRVDLQLKKCEQVRLRFDVTMIVAGVFLRENADGRPEVLLIQEAAKKCRGQWFLPAGRVEPGETIEAAVKREVEEEAGVKCNVRHLISMNVSDGNWYRMAFYCNVTGGQPKTTADKESLQAQWHDVDAIKGGHLKLRGTDIFRLIDEAVRYRGWRTAVPRVLNVDEPQQGLFIELMLVKRDSNGQLREVLVHSSVTSEADVTTRIDPFPVVSFYHKTKDGFTDAISMLYDHLLEDGQHALDTPSELLGTWCLPSPVDSVWNGGLRVRVLGRLRTPSNDARIKDPALFHWQALSDATIVALNLHKDAFRARLFL